MASVAIVGAGLSGLVLARQLSSLADVKVFEKSRGVGGRMSTRRAGEFEFDHGAQFFVARTPAFREFLAPLVAEGVVQNWRAEFAEMSGSTITATRTWGDDFPHFVGSPRMNSVGKYLAEGLDVQPGRTVTRIDYDSPGWQLYDAAGSSLGRYDWLVLTAPAEQTSQLGSVVPALTKAARVAAMQPCFALMLGFDSPLQLPWQAALVREADVSWISVNSSKPGRGEPFTLVVHSTNAWAAANLELERDSVAAHLLAATSAVLGHDLEHASVMQLQRWRYANADKREGQCYFCEDDLQVAACGDWFVRGRVESAFSSADSLARRLRPLLGAES